MVLTVLYFALWAQPLTIGEPEVYFYIPMPKGKELYARSDKPEQFPEAYSSVRPYSVSRKMRRRVEGK